MALVASLFASGCLCAFASCCAELRRREVRPRPEVVVLLDEGEAEDRDEHRERRREGRPPQCGKHEQADDEREQRCARVRCKQRDEEQHGQRGRPAATPQRHEKSATTSR